mgnify:CR=1 FL=1
MNFDNMGLYDYYIRKKDGNLLTYHGTKETIIFSTKLEAIQNLEAGEIVIKRTK